MEWKTLIEAAWADRGLLKEETYQLGVRAVMDEVDKGRLRVASPTENGWVVRQGMAVI